MMFSSAAASWYHRLPQQEEVPTAIELAQVSSEGEEENYADSFVAAEFRYGISRFVHGIKTHVGGKTKRIAWATGLLMAVIALMASLSQDRLSFLPESTIKTIRRDPTSPQSRALKWVQDHPEYSSMPDWRKRQLMALVSLLGPSHKQVSYAKNECQWFSTNGADACTRDGRVQKLEINYSKLITRLPPELSLLTSLAHLKLEYSHLEGTLPSQLGSLQQLTTLNLDRNHLTGTIPTQMGGLTRLHHLYLYHSQLTGTIPTTISALTRLQYLDLEGNRLTGPIPTQLGSLTRLTNLRLNQNELTGVVPIEINNMRQLALCDLKNNPLQKCVGEEEQHTAVAKCCQWI